MQNEIWKDILGFEGKYQVSSHGRIKNLEREVKTRGTGIRTIKERIRKPQVKKNRYHITTLCKGNSETVTYSVHQMVAQAFFPDFVKGTELNHIDGDPENNCVANLEISNPSHNQLHAIRTGLVKPKGTSKYRLVSYITNNPRAKARWAVCVRHAGKSSYGWKTFMTELEAAKYADELLDSINDTSRLRNFP